MWLGTYFKVDGEEDNDFPQPSLVEVEERMGATTFYKLHYALDILDEELKLLTDSRIDRGSEISVITKTDAGNHCLVKGPVRGQRIYLQHGGEGSVLEVRGSDTTIVMDRVAKSKQWKDKTDSEIVQDILTSEYKKQDYSLKKDPTSARHTQEKHTLIQHATDLNFIRTLARRNGYLFWVTADENSNETANFKQPPLSGSSDIDLVINVKNPSVQQFDITWDVERPTSVEAKQLNLNTKKDDVNGSLMSSTFPLLGAQGLADITGDKRSTYLITPADETSDLKSRSRGLLMESNWFIQAFCETCYETIKNTVQASKLVRTHSIVNVEGAGGRHSGKYLCSAVKHVIDAMSHRMEIELIRNAWGKEK